MQREWEHLFPSEHGRPAREQNLLIATSKHLYATREGLLKYQRKPLDPRVPGTKTLLTRMIVLDVGSGVYYGELHDHESAKDLAGFLARAWSVKGDHPMRGIPDLLNVPRSIHQHPEYKQDLELVVRLTNLRLGDLGSGFSAGAHAAKGFENQVNSYAVNRASLFVAQRCSGVMSYMASHSSIFLSEERWASVEPPSQAFFDAIDGLYDDPGAWRESPWDMVLKGIKAPGSGGAAATSSP